MKISFPLPRQKICAITLIESLVVIFIVFVLVAMLLPFGSRPGRAPYAKVKTETMAIATAVEAYKQTYGRYPVPTNVETAASALKEDFTCGGPALNAILGSGANTPLNNDVIAILMDITKLPGGEPTVNSDHKLNPQQIVFLNGKLSGNTNGAGVGTDLVYWDTWGHPYIITMDLNGDGKCRDAFYTKHLVSRKDGAIGFGGLKNFSDTNGMSDLFEYEGGVMVWSFGPDGKADASKSSDSSPNKDNITSW